MKVSKLMIMIILLTTITWSSPLVSPSSSPSSSSSSSSSSPSKSSSAMVIIRITVSILLGVITGTIAAIVVALLLRCFIHYLNKTPLLNGPVIFSPKIPPHSLLNFAAAITATTNNSYYTSVLDNGLTVAVKTLQHSPSSPPNTKLLVTVQQHLQLLATFRHRNLMTLRAFICHSGNNSFSLVYDYMPNGSLYDAIHKVRLNQSVLNWEFRLRIAVGIIKALRYLHFECSPPVFHCNLKPTNVMLDDDFEPRLADCGLAKLMPSLDRATTATTAGRGYVAPECLQDWGRYSEKSDVFAFGVILGVLLTGRDPMDLFFEEGTASSNGGSLGRWLRHLQEAGEAREAIDKSILGDEVEEDEMLMAVRIAVVCLSDSPAHRPSSDELVPMLTQLHSF